MLQRRQIALKLPHGAWRRAGLAERLAREREILAGLEHPHIARLYDAGVAGGGRPYLALEWIDGERIDRFADRHGLDVRARVRLVVQVAQAVAHAHAQLVVHRDLKPANILVTSDGVPKLLDQGTAEETALTQVVGRALMPDYAAPEQLAGGPVGTAADQYALGVVLYELLAGVRPPRAVPSLPGGVADAALQAEPPAPSAVAPAERRRALSGDLDTIVRTALAADPAQRHGSVDRFAADLERHLAGRPVLARPIGALERLGKFVRRHRAGVASATALTVAVVLGAGVALWQAAAAREGQQRAERALEFVASIFRDADPWQSGAERRDARQLLQVARARIDTEFADAPLVRAELLVVLAEALVGVQDESAAAESAEAGLSALAGRAGEGHPLALRARLALFEAHFYRDDLAAARPPLQAVLDVVRADPQRHAALHIPAQANLALLEIDEGRIAEGERTALAVLALAAEAPGRWTMREIELWRAVALARRLRSDPAGALEAARRALDLAEQQYRAAPRHPDLLDTRSRHATALAAAGRASEAVVTLREVVEQVAQAAGPYSRAAAVQLHRLAGAEQLAGEPAAARASAERALALLRRHNPAASPGIGAALATLAEGRDRSAVRLTV
jgi:serine/threonine-protein kinase